MDLAGPDPPGLQEGRLGRVGVVQESGSSEGGGGKATIACRQQRSLKLIKVPLI